MSKKFILIGNPIAGGGAGRKISRAATVLESRGIDAELRFTAKKGDAEAFAREASAKPDTIIIAAGGDGTYNEVANGLIGSDTPLAILPLGTTSVLARECGIPLDPEKALEIAINGKISQIHAGRISFRFGKDRNVVPAKTSTLESSRHFLLMAGIGYDGDSVYRVNERIKKYSGKMAYILCGIGAIINYNPALLRIRASIADRQGVEDGRFRIHPRHCSISGEFLESSGYTIIVSKAACYGGDMKITPDASLTSPYLYVFLTHTKDRVNLVRYLTAIISGRVMNLRDISYFRTDSIEIEGDSHIQIDGDYAGKTPAKLDVVRNALKLIVPDA